MCHRFWVLYPKVYCSDFYNLVHVYHVYVLLYTSTDVLGCCSTEVFSFMGVTLAAKASVLAALLAPLARCMLVFDLCSLLNSEKFAVLFRLRSPPVLIIVSSVDGIAARAVFATSVIIENLICPMFGPL